MKRNQPIQQIDLGKDILAHNYSETVFLIGRSKDCHVVLDDKKISREHARIIHRNGNWFIEKTNIDNKCEINGEDFEKHELEVGDVFTVENFSVTVDSLKPTLTSVSITQNQVNSPNVIKEEKIISKQDDEVFEDHRSKSNATSTDLNISAAALKDDLQDLGPESSTDDEFAEMTVDSNDEEVEFDEGAREEIDHQVEDFSSQSLANQNTDAEISMDSDLSENNDENMSYSLENIESGNDDESTRVIQSFASVYLELFGDTAPYDRYVVENEKTYIGRDPAKCQIILNDTEVSSQHAVLVKNNINLTIEDLNSSNGTLYKGNRVNKVTLNHNDEFIIGSVTFTVKIRSEFLKDESATLMAVDENQTVEVEEVVEVQAEEGEQLDALGDMVSEEPVEKSIIKRVWKDEQQRKKLIYGAVILVGLWVFLGEEETAPVAPVAKNAKKSTTKAKQVEKKSTNPSQKKLTEEQMRSFSALYEIGKEHYNNGRYREALSEFQKIAAVDPNFNASLQSLISLSKEGLSKIEQAEKEWQAKAAAAEKKTKVNALLEKAREYTKDRRIELAQSTFNEITQLDPENFEVSKMKLELDDWQKEKQRKELEEAQKKKDREDKIEKLKPSKSLFLQNEWFKAIGKLEDFLNVKNMDEDLISEATEMLKKSKEELNSAVSPLSGKAKSLLEGQDLKGAYEVYQQILKIEPSNAEALNQIGDIKEQLTIRARKIYREAIIAESLSLFQDAKEKFQEVQQVSPVDSDYYKKASDKLKDYLE